MTVFLPQDLFAQDAMAPAWFCLVWPQLGTVAANGAAPGR